MSDKSKYAGESKDETSETNGQNGTDYRELYEQSQAELAKKEKDYVGLQGTVQKKDDALKETQTRLSELTTNHSKAQSDLEKLVADKETLSATLSEKEVALAAKTTEITRAKLIMKEFPELAIFEAQGLLPQTGSDATEDKLKELFGNFKTTINAIAGKASQKTKEDLLSGGVPKGGGTSDADLTGAVDPAAQHLALYQQATLSGNQKEADKQYELYSAAKYKGKPIET